jgi:uncharacterized protein (TIGR00661 family)
MSDKITFAFIVQGEGRGHMTQALSLQKIILDAGHSLSCVIVGKSSRRDLPGFFSEKCVAPIYRCESPNFVTDGKDKSIRLTASVLNTLRHIGVYRKSLSEMDAVFLEHKPDIIINFYDVMGALHAVFGKYKAKYVCIAHQYLLMHPSFTYPKGRIMERIAITLFNRIASMGTNLRIALSFYDTSPVPSKKLVIAPPLLRGEVFEQKVQHNKHFFLVYMVNAGYSEDVIKWHEKNKDIFLHCFWDRRDMPEEYHFDDTLTFHQLNDQKFLHFMSTCTGLITTAGFESICEAMYFQKPVFMMPVEGQFEQACNAIDATKAGAGISASTFDIDKFMEYLPQFKRNNEKYKTWVTKSPEFMLKYLEELI